MRIIQIVLVLLCLSVAVFGQSAKKKKKQKREDTKSAPSPTSLNPNMPTENYAPRRSKKASKGATYSAEKDYYDRMAELQKTRRKNERMQDDPQYSDPSYFGHKRPPKKHKPGKMKYCKVCGLKH